MVKLTNPLTIEERLQVPRLIGHDTGNYCYGLMNYLSESEVKKAPVKRIASDYLAHIGLTLNAVYILTQREDFETDKKFNESSLDTLEKLFKEKVTHSCTSFLATLSSSEPVLHSVLFNLIKNGLQAQADIDDVSFKKKEERKVDISVDYFSKFPENALYIPEGARDYPHFLSFNVHDEGKGFPQDKPLLKHIVREPPKRGWAGFGVMYSGFGLYFTGLASKVLRAPIDIKSEPRNTTVTVYHPVYE